MECLAEIELKLHHQGDQKITCQGGSVAQWLAYLILNPVAPVSIPRVQSNNMLMLLRLINGAAQRKVDSGLKMLIKPIQYWLVASQYYENILNFETVSFFPIGLRYRTVQGGFLLVLLILLMLGLFFKIECFEDQFLTFGLLRHLGGSREQDLQGMQNSKLDFFSLT